MHGFVLQTGTRYYMAQKRRLLYNNMAILQLSSDDRAGIKTTISIIIVSRKKPHSNYAEADAGIKWHHITDSRLRRPCCVGVGDGHACGIGVGGGNVVSASAAQLYRHGRPFCNGVGGGHVVSASVAAMLYRRRWRHCLNRRRWRPYCIGFGGSHVVSASVATILYRRQWRPCCVGSGHVVSALVATILYRRQWRQCCFSVGGGHVVSAAHAVALYRRRWRPYCIGVGGGHVVSA